METSQERNTGWMPAAAVASALLTILIGAGVGLASVAVSTLAFGMYGYFLFIGLPFALGVLTVVLHGMGGGRGIGQCLGIVTLMLVAIGGGMLLLPLEGVGCILMAMPIWVTFGLMGTLCAYPFHAARWRGTAIGGRGFPVYLLLVLASLPGMLGAERAVQPQAVLTSVVSSVDIDAPVAEVWKDVIAFPDLPAPHDWVFGLGAAYPIRAVIAGTGAGAIRRCEFSTGDFVEPITTWRENELLAFDVSASPPSMKEWSLYPNLHPPHLENYLVSRRGQFRLTALGNNRTRLEGTTWYTNQMFPAVYWQQWSDMIIHHIHIQVLGHIKDVAEASTRGSSQTPASAAGE